MGITIYTVLSYDLCTTPFTLLSTSHSTTLVYPFLHHLSLVRLHFFAPLFLGMSGTEPPFTPPSKTERSEGQPMTEQQKVQEQWPPRSRIMANTPQNLSLLFPRHSPEQSILNVIISECGYRTTRPTKKPNSLFFPLPYTPAYLPGVFILFFSYLFALFIYPPFFGFFYFHSRVYFGKWHRAELGKVLGTSPEEPRKRVQPDIYKEKKRNTVYLLRPVPYTAVALTIPSPSRPSYFVHGA